jgi:hypothetical protein
MARKRYSSEQIIGYLREAEILQAKKKWYKFLGQVSSMELCRSYISYRIKLNINKPRVSIKSLTIFLINNSN